MSKIRRAIGLMSGTSMDGIDVALLQTDGANRLHRVDGASYGYDADFRELLSRAMADAVAITTREERPGSLAEAEREITARHGAAVEQFLNERGIEPHEIDVIGFHGQTVLHRPEASLTVQLGDGPALAAQTRIDVVYDFRAADCAAGGEGAPLAPIYHQALGAKLPQRPVMFVNVGGVANVTYLGFDGRLIAFDTGPGNALIDDWMLRQTGETRDQDGALAASGTIDEAVLAHLLAHEFFAKPAPKSLDRNDFSLDTLAGLSPADGAATLTAFTAETIAEAANITAGTPELWVVCGGGRHNRTLMAMLAERVDNAVVPAEAVHLNGDTLEAEAFAFLAVRSLDGLPLTFPATTGVPRPMTGGIMARAKPA